MPEQHLFNPSSHRHFFPHHLTSLGHIETDSSGHMRPGCEMAYRFSLPSHHNCCRALDTVFIDMISFNIVYFACQVIVIGIYLLFQISYKKHFSFGLVVAMSRAPPSPLQTQDTVMQSCMHQVRTGGAITWQVLFFLPRVAVFPQPRSHMTWIFIFLVLFA